MRIFLIIVIVYFSTLQGLTQIFQMPDIIITSENIAGCDPKIVEEQMVKLPYFRNAWQKQIDCNIYDRDIVSIVLIHFYARWENEFGDNNKKLLHELNRITIFWGVKPRKAKNIYDINGKHLEEAEIIGLCQGLSFIWVLGSEDTPLIETALIHELVHYALGATTGKTDFDHEGTIVPGWTSKHTTFIKDLRSDLRRTYGF
jgi:hypothetical protein